MQNLQHAEVNLWPFMVNALIKKIWGISNAMSECLLYIWINLSHSWLFTAGTISGEEIPIVSKTNIKEYRDSFSCEKFSFHSNPNITFYVYVSNFSWPIKIQVRTHFDWFGFYLNTPFVKWKSTKTNVSKMIWSSLIWKSIIQLCTGISLHLVVHKIESALKWQCVTLPDA